MALKHYEHCCSTIQALASLGKIEGVIPLLHGPQPCSYQNQVGSMSCRPSQLLTAGTLVNKSDVIFGGEAGLKLQIANLYKKYNPKVIVIINTCVPQLIGEDIDGVIIELKQEIPELKVTYAQTGFNFPRSMPLGSDVSWVAVVETFKNQDKIPGSIGIVGRAGQDAGNLAALEISLKKAGLNTFVFPTPHIDEMERIVRAEKFYPIHITPWLTCKQLNEKFNAESRYIEIPAGIQGTSRFLRGIADYEECQKLHDIVDEEEKRVKPELEKIRKEFAKQKVRMLLVAGPANEVSVGKIFAEFGAEVFMVPSMKNRYMQQEKKIMQERYGVTFIEEDFDTVGRRDRPDQAQRACRSSSRPRSNPSPISFPRSSTCCTCANTAMTMRLISALIFSKICTSPSMKHGRGSCGNMEADNERKSQAAKHFKMQELHTPSAFEGALWAAWASRTRDTIFHSPPGCYINQHVNVLVNDWTTELYSTNLSYANIMQGAEDSMRRPCARCGKKARRDYHRHRADVEVTRDDVEGVVNKVGFKDTIIIRPPIGGTLVEGKEKPFSACSPS